MADGSLSDDVLRAYLVQDHRFVNSFSQLLAAMCAAKDRRSHTQMFRDAM